MTVLQRMTQDGREGAAVKDPVRPKIHRSQVDPDIDFGFGPRESPQVAVRVVRRELDRRAKNGWMLE